MNLDHLRRGSEKLICAFMPFIYFGPKIADGLTKVRKRWQQCLKGVNLLKTMLVACCMVMVGQQISTSIRKLIDIPITTYTHFDFNKTIAYPSVTFCREPPYKIEKLLKYGLKSYPRAPLAWSSFNFSTYTLQQLWDEITYDDKEVFVQYTLNGRPENLNITSTLGLNTGRCFTLSPKIQVNRASQASGYSVILQHTDSDISISTSQYPPGYHVHVHYVKEPYTEVEVYNGGLVDYLYVNSGETVDVKLTVDQYIKLSLEEDPCTDATNYSTNGCTTRFVWDTVTSLAGCSGPWMTSDLPHCTNYTDMVKLLSGYLHLHKNHKHTECPRICRSYLYNAFVTARQSFFKWDSSENQWFMSLTGDIPAFTQVYIHFNSMMVSVYEERYNYDWNLFLSDLGGSVNNLLKILLDTKVSPAKITTLATIIDSFQGFLLGLSVIGLVNILTKMWYLIKPSGTPDAEKVTPGKNPADSMEIATIDQYKNHKKFAYYNILNY